MKYPIETLLAGLEVYRDQMMKNEEKALARNIESLDSSIDHSNKQIRAWLDAIAEIRARHFQGHNNLTTDGNRTILVNDDITDVFDRHMAGTGYRSESGIPGRNSRNIEILMKNVQNSQKDIKYLQKPSPLEGFLQGCLEEGETHITDYAVQAAGFTTKLGEVYSNGRQELARREADSNS